MFICIRKRFCSYLWKFPYCQNCQIPQELWSNYFSFLTLVFLFNHVLAPLWYVSRMSSAAVIQSSQGTAMNPFSCSFHDSYLNRRITEQFRLEETSWDLVVKLTTAQAEPPEAGYPGLYPVGFEYPRGWRLHNISGEPVPAIFTMNVLHSHDDFFSCVQMNFNVF